MLRRNVDQTETMRLTRGEADRCRLGRAPEYVDRRVAESTGANHERMVHDRVPLLARTEHDQWTIRGRGATSWELHYGWPETLTGT